MWSRFVALVAAASAAACNDDTATNSLGEVIPGVSITASVAGGDAGFLIASVSFNNRTREPVQVHYPAGCPVRLQFYRRGRSAPVFDEGGFPCDVATIVPFEIPSLTTRDLVSGFRSPNTILGDSLTPGQYDVIAILRITGEQPIEIEAGTVRLAPIPTAEQHMQN